MIVCTAKNDVNLCFADGSVEPYRVKKDQALVMVRRDRSEGDKNSLVFLRLDTGVGLVTTYDQFKQNFDWEINEKDDKK